ncbi:hypothetical protein OROHE_014823 [Orobanche hederae]
MAIIGPVTLRSNSSKKTWAFDSVAAFDMVVTLWGSLGDVLIENKIKNAGLHAVILTSVNVKLYNDKLYLSSNSSTLILDDDEIHALKEFTSEASEIESVTFNCQVIINNIRTRIGWNYPSCGGDKCKKGVTRKEGKFWCDACNKHSEYPVVRYMLELDVSNDTAHTMVVMFDETATELVKFSAESLLEGEDEATDDQPALPQALTNIIGTSHTLDTVSAGANIGKPKLKRLSKSPSVSTPSKPSEDKRKKNVAIEDSDTEITAARSEVPKDDEDDKPASKKKKKRYIMEDSESE